MLDFLLVLRRLLPLLVLATACSGGSHPAATPDPADVLSDLAASGIAATYQASYVFHQSAGNQDATVKVWHTPAALRVDVLVGATTATLIIGTDATYSCAVTAKGRSCLTIATAGQPLPAPFDVAPTTLFRTDLQQLSGGIASYTVGSAPAATASGGVPAARCFAVAPKPGVADVKVARGTYCFAGTGVLTAATYPSGNTVRLTSVQATVP